MGFWTAMLCCSLLLPLIMTAAGWLMYRRPPKRINGLVGYRTAMSMKNQDTWQFAHDRCGRLWLKLGLGMLLPSVLVQLPFAHAGDEAVGMLALLLQGAQLILLVGSIVPVERALRRTFDENGRRR